jgi:malate dehydrogenase (quinone)
MNQTGPDAVLIGAGIMSATLATLLKELEPAIRLDIYERMGGSAAESSDAWNNAGTGHAAYCELNYTPQRPDGSIDISKALRVSEAFEQSKQFWTYLVRDCDLDCPVDFIKPVPHCAFVHTADNRQFLKKRWEAMTAVPFFKGMLYSESPEEIASWMPLVMQGRPPEEPVAATRMNLGTDVDFGSLTRELFARLMRMEGVKLHFGFEVRDIERISPSPGTAEAWELSIKDLHSGDKRKVKTPFVFIGAGGGALPLLQKSGIPQGKHFGGFPVSGQWLRCSNAAVIAQHHAKVYGKAAVGAPPMSVPHLDARRINNEPALLFGPFAGFSTKFLKEGSLWDLPRSIRFSNIAPMVSAGLHNLPLTKYLIRQVMQSEEDRMAALREYYPLAKEEDWDLEVAGQRVQIIKADEAEGGVLEFGTELVASSSGSLAALLGASPGASTAVNIMIGLLERCFPKQMQQWRWKLKEMMPSYGRSLAADAALLEKVRRESAEVLGIGTP